MKEGGERDKRVGEGDKMKKLVRGEMERKEKEEDPGRTMDG